MGRFEVTSDHLALLHGAYVSWNHSEAGAPGIDCKRPYGSSGQSSFLRDIWKLVDLGEEEGWDHDHDLPRDLTPASWKERVEYYMRLHKETETALAIVLATGLFQPGWYQASEFGRDWEPVAIQVSSPPLAS